MTRVREAHRLVEEEGLSQRQIADRMGYCQATVSLWMKEPRLNTPACPLCDTPMIEPADMCGFCEEELAA